MRNPNPSIAIARLALLIATASTAASAQTESEIWDLGSLESGRLYTTRITVANDSCRGRHNLQVLVEDAPWLRLDNSDVTPKVRRGESASLTATVDLVDVAPGAKQGRIRIHCLSCPPTCNQDLSSFEVRVLVQPAPDNPSSESIPVESSGPPSKDTESLPRSQTDKAADPSPTPADPQAAPRTQQGDDGVLDVSDDKCVVAKRKTQVYSRGQNNADQMKQQAELSRQGKLQYETARFTVLWTLRSGCTCNDDDSACEGTLDVGLRLTVDHLNESYESQLIGEPRDEGPPKGARALVAVAPPDTDKRTKETDRSGGARDPAKKITPRPNLELHAPSSFRRLPAFDPERGPEPFRKEEEKEEEGDAYIAEASTTIPCFAGDHAARFILVEHDVLQQPQLWQRSHNVMAEAPQIIADANISLANDACKLDVLRFEAFLVEFRQSFPFPEVSVRGARGLEEARDPGEELPRLEHRIGNRRKATTRSLLKLIQEDGRKLDDAFPEKAKGVRAGD